MIPYYHIPCHTIPYQFTCQLVQWNKKVHVLCCTMPVQLCTIIHNSVSFLFMHRLLFASDKWTKEQKEQLDKSISDYLMENCSDTQSIITQLEHITSITRTTERDQFLLLSTISNFHWTHYPSLQATSVISKTRSTRYSDHIVFDPDQKQHVPTSPQNHLLHLQMSESNYTNYMNTFVEFLLNQDKEPET